MIFPLLSSRKELRLAKILSLFPSYPIYMVGLLSARRISAPTSSWTGTSWLLIVRGQLVVIGGLQEEINVKDQRRTVESSSSVSDESEVLLGTV
jgi:hypothetical protein